MLKYVFIGLLTVLLSSCLDEIKLAQPAFKERIIVEGGISTSPNDSFLRLSLTAFVGAPKQVLPSSGVYAEIRSGKGKTYILRADPAGSGLFTPESGKIIAQEGESYALYLKLADGRTYLSPPQTVPKTVPIQNLSYTVLDKSTLGYTVVVDVQDPAATENYYRWRAEGYHLRQSSGVRIGFGDNFCCKTCWVKTLNEDINILSDRNFNGNLIKNQAVFYSPYYGKGMHKIRVKQFQISREAFQYYTKLKSQIGRTGSIFDPLPATVKGNVVNTSDAADTALGFFEVSAVNTKQLNILDEALDSYNAFYSTSPLYFLQGDCLLRFPYAIYFEDNKQQLFD